MTGSPTFTARIHQLHHALDQAEVTYAFGGAIALGWCIPQARATNDIDINIFLPPEQFEQALDALPDEVEITERSREQLRRDGQTRLRWGVIPVDVFLNTTEFHQHAATRIRRWDFVGVEIPCLSCDDLAVFKAFYDRPKDWVDIGEMVKIASFDIAEVRETLADLLGSDDERISKLADAQAEADRMLRRAAGCTEE